MIERIVQNDLLLAIIISHRFDEGGIHFVTPENLSQQLAYMKYPSGKEIPPHLHNPVTREVQHTQEVLFLRKGKLRVDFYDGRKVYLESRILEAGDTILFASGGHGFEVLEDLEMIEVKQGPYAGDHDKTRFEAVDKKQLKVEE